MLDPHARGDALERRLGDLGPFEEGDAVGREVVVEQGRVLGGERAEAIEVEVGDLGVAAEQVPDRVKVGLVTGPSTPKARAAPRTKVVLPAPSSPLTSTTSPGRRRAASCAPAASVSLALAVSTIIRHKGASGARAAPPAPGCRASDYGVPAPTGAWIFQLSPAPRQRQLVSTGAPRSLAATIALSPLTVTFVTFSEARRLRTASG